MTEARKYRIMLHDGNRVLGQVLGRGRVGEQDVITTNEVQPAHPPIAILPLEGT